MLAGSAQAAARERAHGEGESERFIGRLRLAIAWVNRNRRNFFLQLCSDRVDRATEVLERQGARTSF